MGKYKSRITRAAEQADHLRSIAEDLRAAETKEAIEFPGMF